MALEVIGANLPKFPALGVAGLQREHLDSFAGRRKLDAYLVFQHPPNVSLDVVKCRLLFRDDFLW